MAKAEEKVKTVSGSGRGNVPTVGYEVGITLNMGDYSSLRIVFIASGIDASSDEATKREAAQIERSSTILYEVVDRKTGEVLNAALGDSGEGEVQAAFMRAIAEVMERRAKKGKK